jgi:hypothetical protein
MTQSLGAKREQVAQAEHSFAASSAPVPRPRFAFRSNSIEYKKKELRMDQPAGFGTDSERAQTRRQLPQVVAVEAT